MPKVTFLPEGLVADIPAGSTILQAAKSCGAHEGDACGGKCACSTCHVYVRVGAEHCSEATDDENDILDKAFDVKLSSRLGCQTKVSGDVTVEISSESRQAYLNEHPEVRHGT